jgi:beta-phosphoglucomutase-like phosphatase (HAD superfamily)
MAEQGATTPEEVLTALRVRIYNEMVSDPAVIRANEWPHTTGLLRVAKETFCGTALATMSQRKEALHVLQALGLESYLDVILSREDVKNAKPDPEIYLLGSSGWGCLPSSVWCSRIRSWASAPVSRPE